MSSGAQMLAGGIMLAVVAALRGEGRGLHLSAVSSSAWFALIYLVFAGSIAGFTAYVWLLHHESPTKVGTYAYVNPVVAVLLGYWLGGEPLGLRTIAGGLFRSRQRCRHYNHAPKSMRSKTKPARREKSRIVERLRTGKMPGSPANFPGDLPAPFRAVLTFCQLACAPFSSAWR